VAVTTHDLGGWPRCPQPPVDLWAYEDGTSFCHELGHLVVGISPSVEAAASAGEACRDEDRLLFVYAHGW
jgi:hypothetical protein